MQIETSLGLVVVLHTFGRDMKFNPHLHIISNLNRSISNKFNIIWRRVVLNSLMIQDDSYYYGYYIHSGRRVITPKQIAKYTGRYVRHPAIANGRIIAYNKISVTFFYKDNLERKIIITRTVHDFISSLIQHIPPKQFKIVRYYGSYSRKAVIPTQ